jgi:uncharacterized protein YsxB (DUF464 family)
LIEVRLILSKAETPQLLEIHAKGHAFRKKGQESLTCGAFSMLLKVFSGLVEQKLNSFAELKAQEPGLFDYILGALPQGMDQWYQGVTDMMLRGMADLERDNPREIKIEVYRR